MNHEANRSAASQTHLHQGADGADHLAAAFNHLRGFLSERGSTPGSVSHTDQENSVCEWAVAVGRLLTLEAIPAVRRRGGQEHDVLDPVREGRLWKVTKSGYFGLTPGLELGLVPAGVDGRRFHLWESGIYWYLERLVLQNELSCRPSGGFLEFIEKTLQAGELLRAVRTTRTTDSPINA